MLLRKRLVRSRMLMMSMFKLLFVYFLLFFIVGFWPHRPCNDGNYYFSSMPCFNCIAKIRDFLIYSSLLGFLYYVSIFIINKGIVCDNNIQHGILVFLHGISNLGFSIPFSFLFFLLVTTPSLFFFMSTVPQLWQALPHRYFDLFSPM